MILSMLLLFLLIISIISIIVLCCFSLFQFIIIFIIIFLCFSIFLSAWFNHRCRKYINNNKNIKIIKPFIQRINDSDGCIVFKSDKNVFSCDINNDQITFELSGFLFKKSFIRAYVVRQIRYKTVSKKLKISKLFSLRLRCKCKYRNIYLIIDNHRYLIISNEISKNSLLSSIISKSKYASMYLSLRSFVSSNIVQEINEKKYLNYYLFYKNR